MFVETPDFIHGFLWGSCCCNTWVHPRYFSGFRVAGKESSDSLVFFFIYLYQMECMWQVDYNS